MIPVPDDRCDLLCLDLPKAERIRGGLLSDDAAAAAALKAAALGDPTRLRLVAALTGGEELCVCDLAWIAGRSENLVSHHVRTLRAAGLARSRRQGKLVLYRLTPAGEALAAAVLEPVGVRV